MTSQAPSTWKTRGLAVLMVLYTITLVAVFSRNQLASESVFARQICEWTEGFSEQAKLEGVVSYQSMVEFIQSTLHDNIQSPASVDAEKQYLANPNVLQTIYYQVGNSSDFVIGAFQLLEIPLSPLNANCVSNGLMNHLEISCLPEYAVAVRSEDTVRGKLDSYSVGDAKTNVLIYDLGSLVPSLDSRVVAIRLNMLNVNSGNIGIVEIVFEKSVHGPVVGSSNIVVVPSTFVYPAGRRDSIDIATLTGKVAILIFSVIFFLISLVRLKNHFLESLLPLLITALTISSISIEFYILLASPLVEADLGVSQYVNLQWVARRFLQVNQLNGLVVVCLVHWLIFFLFTQLPPLRLLLPIAASWGVCLVTFAVILNLLFPTNVSFVDAVEYLIRICLGNVTRADFDFFHRSLGFEGTVILVAFVFVYLWFLGLAIGTLLVRPPSESVSEIVQPTSKPAVVDPLMGSIEMMAGKALSEIEAVRAVMDSRLEEVKRGIAKSAAKIRETNLQ